MFKTKWDSIDPFVNGRGQVGWQRQAKLLERRAVGAHGELRRPLDGQIGGLRTLEYLSLIHI